MKLLGDALWVQEIKGQTYACASRGQKIIWVLWLSFMNKQKTLRNIFKVSGGDIIIDITFYSRT